jgi:hypothetical protein
VAVERALDYETLAWKPALIYARGSGSARPTAICRRSTSWPPHAPA